MVLEFMMSLSTILTTTKAFNMGLEDATSLMEAYKLRYIQVCDDPNVNHVVIFKNQGYKAGDHFSILTLKFMDFLVP